LAAARINQNPAAQQANNRPAQNTIVIKGEAATIYAMAWHKTRGSFKSEAQPPDAPVIEIAGVTLAGA
jgi:hypothetical protein